MLARKGKSLYYKNPGYRFCRLSAESDLRFFSKNKDIVLTLLRGLDGNISQYKVVSGGIEELAVKIDFQNRGIINQNIVVLPRILLLILGSVFALAFLICLSRIIFSPLRQKKLSKLSQVWIILSSLAGICIIYLILKDGDILEELLNLGSYNPGLDEILIFWVYLILSVGVVLMTLLAWIKRTDSIFTRNLLSVLSVTSVCLVMILQRIGILVLFP